MLAMPTKFTLVAGRAEGNTKLTAFDKALLDAKIGNLNLLRVSSILPPNCEYSPELKVPYGSLMPTAYGTISSDVPGELISAAVGVGIAWEDSYGVIMEFSGRCSKQEAEQAVADMVREAFAARGLPLNKLLVQGVEHRVEKIGSVIAAVALWY